MRSIIGYGTGGKGEHENESKGKGKMTPYIAESEHRGTVTPYTFYEVYGGGKGKGMMTRCTFGEGDGESKETGTMTPYTFNKGYGKGKRKGMNFYNHYCKEQIRLQKLGISDTWAHCRRDDVRYYPHNEATREGYDSDDADNGERKGSKGGEGNGNGKGKGSNGEGKVATVAKVYDSWV